MKRDGLHILKLLLWYVFIIALFFAIIIGGFDGAWSFVGYGGLMENCIVILCFMFPCFLFYKKYSKSLLKILWVFYKIMLGLVLLLVIIDLNYYDKPLLESRFFDALWVVLFMVVFAVLVNFSDTWLSFINKKSDVLFGYFSRLFGFGDKKPENHSKSSKKKVFLDRRMFFDDIGSLKYRSRRYPLGRSLDRDIHEDSYEIGHSINWTYGGTFLAFDLLRYYFYLECEDFNSSNIKNNKHGVIKELFDPFVERYGLKDGEVMSLNDLPVVKTKELGETIFSVGDDWIFDLEKVFNENPLEKELMRQINHKRNELHEIEKRLGEKNLVFNKEHSSVVGELSELETRFRSNRLNQLNEKEKRRHCVCQLLAKSNKKLVFRLNEKNWFWDIPPEMVIKLENLHLNSNIGGPFFPTLRNGPEINNTLGSELDQKIVDVWGVCSEELYSFFLNNCDLAKSSKSYQIIEAYSSVLKKLELSVGRIKREWVLKTQKIDPSLLFNHLPEKVELYCWTGFYSIRKQYYEGEGEDELLNLIEHKLNSVEEKYREELEKQTFNSSLSKQISEIEEKTEALKDDFAGIYNDVKRIKEKGDKTERVVEKIFLKLEKAYNKEDYREFVQKVKSWFLYWEKTEPNTKVFMSGAEFFFNKTASSNYVDYSAFVLYYCRALENELLIKMFNSFVDSCEGEQSMFVLDDSGLSEKRKKEYSSFAKDFKRKFVNKKFTLGDMKMVLKRLPGQNNKAHPLYHRYPVLKRLFLYLENKSFLLDDNSLEMLSKLNDEYRRKAAHLEVIKKDDALLFYKNYKKIMNRVMSLFS